jgi:hypothetical protein
VSDPSSDDQTPGYGQPPKATRWKKGQSGNPRRRYARKTSNTIETIDGLFIAPVRITVDGETRNLTALEALLLQIWRKEMAGGSRALSVRLKFQEFARQNIAPQVEITFVDSDYTRALAGRTSQEGTENE